MHGQREDDLVRVGANARERFHDSRGYGRPDGSGGVTLAPVEAAHLLYRGDLEAVDGLDFRAFLADATPVTRYLVYADLRSRGFYVSPGREGWVDDDGSADLVVHPRGDGPWDGTVAHRVRVVGERESVPASVLGDVALAVVDKESEITYLATDRRRVDGATTATLPTDVPAVLLEDRVLVWDPPGALYADAFYGQRLDREATALQLSLVEAAHLASEGTLAVDGGRGAVLERGRAVEGERFDRRLAAYEELRERGVVPKTGFKFGADFRTYAEVTSVGDLGHSELLVRVLPAGHAFAPRDLALDVRLAHGVRKTMVFALVDGDDVAWLAVERLTP